MSNLTKVCEMDDRILIGNRGMVKIQTVLRSTKDMKLWRAVIVHVLRDTAHRCFFCFVFFAPNIDTVLFRKFYLISRGFQLRE